MSSQVSALPTTDEIKIIIKVLNAQSSIKKLVDAEYKEYLPKIEKYLKQKNKVQVGGINEEIYKHYEKIPKEKRSQVEQELINASELHLNKAIEKTKKNKGKKQPNKLKNIEGNKENKKEIEKAELIIKFFKLKLGETNAESKKEYLEIINKTKKYIDKKIGGLKKEPKGNSPWERFKSLHPEMENMCEKHRKYTKNIKDLKQIS